MENWSIGSHMNYTQYVEGWKINKKLCHLLITCFKLVINFKHCESKLFKSRSDQFNYVAVLHFQYENCVDFLWRLARAYGDLFEMTADAEEKRKYVTDGKRKNLYE